ncbi:hypothetical protein TMatcc_009966 [Talaromyces marneffei ATCC 18224]|uniref:Uncharacterized protein n=2 Tax=Talaromyces marneffei TaxID=37727 RepID=B6QTT3_TALMQ|nr:uncharacterized protein EYB26_009184 [Talaromyces marneffei]EEA19825.1 conserved hypothetical protein [Talaromyces marneffei ATCC 18224]QGA21473.1 hypothetical protein EYB26_009184 [Talaromyces marneffei]
MSTVPKARQSNIEGLIVSPDEWDSYPEISLSTIKNCTFKNLSATTNISRSIVSESTVMQEVESSPMSSDLTTAKAKSKKGMHIGRSTIDNSQILNSSNVQRSEVHGCAITDSTVDRSTLNNCNVSAQSHIERTTAKTTKFIGPKRVERSEFSDSVVLGKSAVERSIVRGSVVAGKAVIERTELKTAVITKSRVERSKISDCDVMDCVIERTDFQGMILQYGIWKRGDLVGRTSNEHEVVIKPRQKPMSTREPEGLSGSAPQPVQNPGSGWKAAEAERERLGVESDHEQEDPSPDELDESSDDETSDPASGHKMKHSRLKNRDQYTSTSAADIHDPPPPYEQ